MDYKDFLKKLEKNKIKLFDYDKRKLFYQLSNKQQDNIQNGGCINKFFQCDNKKIILNFYKKNDIQIDFINSKYENID
tara:strand:+ start:682 stop:915 length:234 start_codon:yes stop_codon:yes gene_type:complete